MPHRGCTGTDTTAPELTQGIRADQDFKRSACTSPLFRERPATYFNIREPRIPNTAKVGLDCRSNLAAPHRVMRKRRMRDAKPLVSDIARMY